MTGAKARADWIAVDWGTTNLRAFAMAGDQVLAQAASDDGMGRLSRDQFEPALLALVGEWLAPDRVTEVVACGMVGSRQGWVEAPYRAVPCTPLGGTLAQAPARDLRVSVHVVPGLRQTSPAADVIRGEETQIAGFIARHPGWDGVLCLPGTHSKWVQISAGEVVSFQTYLTGEMFELLSNGSVLRHGMGTGWDDAAFAAGLEQGVARPEWLAARLFTLRAEGLLTGLDPDAARARLSGLLIGAELAAARPYWLGQRVGLIGASTLAGHYASALRAQSVPVTQLDATDMTLAGLIAAHTTLAPEQQAMKCAH
jgi:2-dehydro-3-deoxygalactonokinase